MLKYGYRLVLLFLMAIPNLVVAAPGDTLAEATCQSADVWSGMIDKVCWSSVFPIYWIGMNIGDGDRPDGANTQPVCVCWEGPSGAKVPVIGQSVGFYQPSRLISQVAAPYCMPAFGGASWGEGLTFGGSLDKDDANETMTNFYNSHYYSFPLMQMLELLLESKCSPDGYTQFDLMYMTEYDPTWNDDELALWLAPESVVFANPLAFASCAAEAVAVTATGENMDEFIQCAGSWGLIYPISGTATFNDSPPRQASLLTTRMISAMHRKGLARRTFGSDAMCGGVIHPFILKSQYKFQQFHPMTEADGEMGGFEALNDVYGGMVTTGTASGGSSHYITGCSHPIGASTFAWGEWRNIPSINNYVNVVFRYTDCCMR